MTPRHITPRRHALLLAAGVHFGMALALVWLSFAGFVGLGATIVHLPDPPECA